MRFWRWRLASFTVVGSIASASIGMCAMLGGCLQGAYSCQSNDDCSGGGICETNGFCSVHDDRCESGRSFGNLAGELAGSCVPLAPEGSGSADSFDTVASLSATEAVGSLDGTSATGATTMAGPASGSTTTAATTSAGADDQSTTGDEGNDASATTGEPTDDTSGASTTETTATTTSSSSTTTGDETTAAACEVEIEVCDGVDNDGDGKIDEYSAANTGLCDGCRLRQRLGRVYWICLGSRSWTSARSDCAAKGAYFAAVGSSGENSFLIAESGVDEVENFWLGGSDPVSDGQTGVFFWDNGGAVFWNGSSGAVGGVFHGFGPDEPDIHNDQHCVEIREEDGLIEWNDEYCTDLQGYICEAAQDETCAD